MASVKLFFFCERLSASMARSLHLRFSLCTTNGVRKAPVLHQPRSAKAYIRPPAVQQVSRLPRESSGGAAETKKRQSVHQTPCSAPSPTPAMRNAKLCNVKLCDVKLCIFFSCVCLMASMARSVNCLGQKNAVQVHLIGAKPIVQVKR